MLHKIIAVAQVPFEPYKLCFILLKHLALSYTGCDGDLVAFLIVLMILMNNKNKIYTSLQLQQQGKTFVISGIATAYSTESCRA